MLEVVGMAVIRENKLLLLWKKSRQWWEWCGGKRDEGETIEQTLHREIREEIGCEIQSATFYKSYDVDSVRFYVYVGDVIGEPQLMEPEAFEKIEWIDIQDAQNCTIAPNITLFLKDYVNESD